MRLLERKEPEREADRCAPSAPSRPSDVYASGEQWGAGTGSEATKALSWPGRVPAAIDCVARGLAAAAAMHQAQ